MKRFFPIFVLLAISCASRPFEGWTNTDSARQIAYSAVHVVDWVQTLDIAKNPDKYSECGLAKNFIGTKPTESRIHLYMGSTLILHTAMSAMLKPKYRKWFQYIWIGIEAGTVYSNYSVGYTSNFGVKARNKKRETRQKPIN